MYLSKHKNGNYYIYYKSRNGKRTSVSCKTDKKIDALKFLSEFQKELEAREATKVERKTLQDYIYEFLSYSEMVHTPKTSLAYTNTFNFVRKHFGKVYLTDLTHSKIQLYLEFRIKTSSKYAARKDLIHLSSFFNRAIAQGFLLKNPCEGIKRIKIPEKQPVYLDEKEFQSLLNVVDSQIFRDLIIFAVNTGMRQGEIINLTWNDVFIDKECIVLSNQDFVTKSGKIRTVPLNLKALDVLANRYNNKGYVFTDSNNEPLKADFVTHRFKKYVRKAGINPRIHFHSLRHTFASWLVQHNESIQKVSQLLGHRDVQTTMIYAHLNSKSLMDAVKKL